MARDLWQVEYTSVHSFYVVSETQFSSIIWKCEKSRTEAGYSESGQFFSVVQFSMLIVGQGSILHPNAV